MFAAWYSRFIEAKPWRNGKFAFVHDYRFTLQKQPIR